MKKSATLIFVLAAFAGAAQAQSATGNYSANDMNVSLSQLYPGAEQDAVAAASTKTREQVSAEFQRSRLVGTSAQYSAVGGYQLKMSFPELFVEPKVAGKTREEVQAEYLASRPAHSPAAFSSLDSYQVSQAFPGNVVDGNGNGSSANKFAAKASSANVQ